MFDVYCSQWASGSSWYADVWYRNAFVLCAQTPIMQAYAYMPPCCTERACCVLCVGGGKWKASIQCEAAWDTNKKKAHQCKPYTKEAAPCVVFWYVCALCSGALASGIWTCCELRCALVLFRWTAIHRSTHFPDILSMHIATRTLL